MQNVPTQRIVLFEGDEVAGTFTISQSGDGLVACVYEYGDLTIPMGVATILLIAFGHLVSFQPKAVPPLCGSIADQVMEVVEMMDEGFPF